MPSSVEFVTTVYDLFTEVEQEQDDSLIFRTEEYLRNIAQLKYSTNCWKFISHEK